MGDYSDYPADYAEVSSFKRTPSEYSGTRSPAPYATTTLIGSSKLVTNTGTKFVFCPSAVVPGNQIDNSSNNNNYGNRNVYSESYFNPNDKAIESRMINTMAPNHFGNQNAIKLEPIKRNRINYARQGNNTFQHPQQQLYVKVGEIVPQNPPSHSSHSTLHSNSGSLQNWNNQNFNIYENHLHDHIVNGAQTSDGNDKEYVFVNPNNVITYINSNEYPDNV